MTIAQSSSGILERIATDPIGAWAVLIAMAILLASSLWIVWLMRRKP